MASVGTIRTPSNSPNKDRLWKHLKHRDLANYNRPRLDLVTHLVIENVTGMPRVRHRIPYVRGLCHIGRAKALAHIVI